MAKGVLINPSPKYASGINEATITPPLGLAYLAAFLEKDGHKVQIIDAHISRIKAENIADNLMFSPDFIGISSNVITHKGAVDCAEKLKAVYPDIPILLGGPYGSSLAQKILREMPFVRAVVIGEGERTLAEIAGRLHDKDIFRNIPGVAYRAGGQIVFNEPRGLVENLDDIPSPAYHLLPDVKMYKSRSRGWPVGYIVTSRGCPFQCTFCNRNIFGSRWRPHSVDRVIEEIRYLSDRYGVRQIDVLDDNFTLDRERAREILERLAKDGPRVYINLQNGVRIDRTDEDLLGLMKDAGVFKIGFGIETANDEIRKGIRKGVDLEKAIRLTRVAKSMGMIASGFFMIGLPGDTLETMNETIEFAIKMNPQIANFAMCIPFPGTELFQEVKEEGVFLEDTENGIDQGFFGTKVFYTIGSMNADDIQTQFKSAYRRFYMRPSKVIDILGTVKSVGEFKWLAKAVKDLIK